MTEIKFELNGKQVTASVDPATPLRELLREEFGLTGTKAACMSGRCGVCTVHVDDTPVKSCLVMAGKIDRASVQTIEGLAPDDELHDIQQAFEDNFASQCGYCTSGFIMAAVPFVESANDPSKDEIRAALKGNVCRCTGYEKILDAVKDAASK